MGGVLSSAPAPTLLTAPLEPKYGGNDRGERGPAWGEGGPLGLGDPRVRNRPLEDWIINV